MAYFSLLPIEEVEKRVSEGDFVVPIKDACLKEGVFEPGYPLGFPVFDAVMRPNVNEPGGVRPGDLVVITGKSGEGKTTFSQNIALNLNKALIPSLFFSYEVTPDNIYAKFKEMGFSDDGVLFAPKRIITGNVSWIRERIVEAKERYFVQAVFIDHIDFLSSSSRTSDQLRVALKNVAMDLKTIALELNVVIFLIAHTKKVEGREIEMQDIAESSGIYQLADYVFSVARKVIRDVEGNAVYTDEGRVRLLKNRPFGTLPYMNYRMVNNLLQPL